MISGRRVRIGSQNDPVRTRRPAVR